MGKTLMDSTFTFITISTWTQTNDIWGVELFPSGGNMWTSPLLVWKYHTSSTVSTWTQTNDIWAVEHYGEKFFYTWWHR